MIAEKVEWDMENKRAIGAVPELYNYKVVYQFSIATIIWGLVGMLVGVIIAAQLVWPELNAHE